MYVPLEHPATTGGGTLVAEVDSGLGGRVAGYFRDELELCQGGRVDLVQLHQPVLISHFSAQTILTLLKFTPAI